MKEQIRKEVMKVYNQESSVDEVVNKLLFLFNVVGRSEQLECDVCYQPTNKTKDNEGYRYCNSCEKL